MLRRLEHTTERAAKQRKDLLAQIENEVKVHTTIEKEIFYPAFKKAVRSKYNWHESFGVRGAGVKPTRC